MGASNVHVHRGGVEQFYQGVAPPGVVGGRFPVTAVVKVLIGALVEAFPHLRRRRDVVVREGVVRAVVPIPWRRVRHCHATCVAVSHVWGTQRDDMAWGGLQLDVGRPGELHEVVETHPQRGQGRVMPLTQWPPARVANSGME